MSTKREELRIWKHEKKKNAEDARKKINGLKGDDVEITCMEWTTLHYLAGLNVIHSNNAVHIPNELLARGLPNQADALGRKPLWYAAHVGNEALIPALINGVTDEDVNAAFNIALDWKRITTACAILHKSPHFECRKETRELFSKLLDKKWDEYKVILAITNEKGIFSHFLNHACWCGDDEIVKRAITLGVSMNEHDLLGRTSLHNAAQKFHLSTTKLLLEAGADPCEVDMSGCTAAHYACSSKSCAGVSSYALLEALVHAKPSVLNQKNNMGRTALMEALYRGNEKIVIFIIKNFLHLLDTSVKDHFGLSYSHYSPLQADELANGNDVCEIPESKAHCHKGRPMKRMKVTIKRHIDRINRNKSFSLAIQMDRNWLIPFGFHEVIKSHQEKTSVLHICIKMNQIEVLHFLAASENCSVQDDHGRSPLALAIDMVNVGAVSCMLQHVSLDPSEIERLLRRCKTPEREDCPWWQIIQMLTNCLDVEKIKDWLIDTEAEKFPKGSHNNKSKEHPTLNLLQYCFLWGSNDLILSICSEVPSSDLTAGGESDQVCSIAELSPLAIGVLLCREEILTTFPLGDVSVALKNKLLVLSCSFGLYAKEKKSRHFLCKSQQEPAEEDVIRFIDELVNCGADPKMDCIVSGPFVNAIQIASFCGLDAVVMKLISFGASPCKSVQNRTALEAALQGYHEELCIEMLETTKENDLDNDLAWKLMTLGCSRGHWQAVNEVADILEQREVLQIDNMYQNYHGDTCLHYCARQGKYEPLQKLLGLLVRAGNLSAMNVVNKNGRSPLCCASLGNNWQCAFLIIAYLPSDYSAKLLLRNEYMLCNLSDKSSQDTKEQFYKQMVKRLLPLLTNVPNGANILLRCCGNGDKAAVENFLEFRPGLVQIEDEKHRGPDFYAAINGHTEILEYVEDFRNVNGFEKPPPNSAGQLLTAILINEARYILRNHIHKRWNLSFDLDGNNEPKDQIRKPHIWDIISKICSEHIDTVSSFVDRFTESDYSTEYLWNNIERLESCAMHITLNFLSLFDQVSNPMIRDYYRVSNSDWLEYKAKFGINENLPYPDALVIALSGSSLVKSDYSFLSSLIQTLARNHCMLMTASVDTFLKCDELNLLCDIFSVESNGAQNKVKLHASFLRSCSAGHFALAAVTSAFLQDDKDIRILGLNLSVASDNPNIVQMLAKGICPCSTISSNYCDALLEEFPRAWRRKLRPGWSAIFAAAASNNLPLLYSFLDTCDHVTDVLLAETALVAASRGSCEVLEHILMRQPRVLYIDTENLTLVKTWPYLATVSLLACCVKSRQDSCSSLVIRHMLSQGYLSQSLVDVLPFACELGLVETVKSLLAIPDTIAFSESQLNIAKCASLELGHLDVFKEFATHQNELLPGCDYSCGFSKFVRDICLFDGEEIPLPFCSTAVITKLLDSGKETTVFHILQRVEELELLSIFTVEDVNILLTKAVKSQSFGVLEPLLSILDHLTSEEKVHCIVYATVCLAVRLRHAESLRSIFLHRNVLNLQIANKPHILHVAAIFGDAEIGKVLLEFIEAKDLEVTHNGETPHELAVGFGNSAMAQVLNPLAVKFH